MGNRPMASAHRMQRGGWQRQWDVERGAVALERAQRRINAVVPGWLVMCRCGGVLVRAVGHITTTRSKSRYTGGQCRLACPVGRHAAVHRVS